MQRQRRTPKFSRDEVIVKIIGPPRLVKALREELSHRYQVVKDAPLIYNEGGRGIHTFLTLKLEEADLR